MDVVIQSQNFLLVLLQVWHAVEGSASNTRPAAHHITGGVFRHERLCILLAEVERLAGVDLEADRLDEVKV